MKPRSTTEGEVRGLEVNEFGGCVGGVEEENGRFEEDREQQALTPDALKVVLAKVQECGEAEAVRVVREQAGLSGATRLWADRAALRELSKAWRKERQRSGVAGSGRVELVQVAPSAILAIGGLYIFLRRRRLEDGTLRWLVNHKASIDSIRGRAGDEVVRRKR